MSVLCPSVAMAESILYCGVPTTDRRVYVTPHFPLDIYKLVCGYFNWELYFSNRPLSETDIYWWCDLFHKSSPFVRHKILRILRNFPNLEYIDPKQYPKYSIYPTHRSGKFYLGGLKIGKTTISSDSLYSKSPRSPIWIPHPKNFFIIPDSFLDPSQRRLLDNYICDPCDRTYSMFLEGEYDPLVCFQHTGSGVLFFNPGLELLAMFQPEEIQLYLKKFQCKSLVIRKDGVYGLGVFGYRVKKFMKNHALEFHRMACACWEGLTSTQKLFFVLRQARGSSLETLISSLTDEKYCECLVNFDVGDLCFNTLTLKSSNRSYHVSVRELPEPVPLFDTHPKVLRKRLFRNIDNNIPSARMRCLQNAMDFLCTSIRWKGFSDLIQFGNMMKGTRFNTQLLVY